MADSPALSTEYDSDDPEEALRAARTRFVSTFPQRIDALRAIIDSFAQSGGDVATATLRVPAHTMAGLAGMVGLRNVSTHATELEILAEATPFDVARARAILDAIGEAFTRDVAVPPAWAAPQRGARGGAIFVIEDDPDQRSIIVATLKSAGYRVIEAGSGDDSLSTARRLRPDAILLDVDLPGADGYTVCRQFKSDPALAHIPVMFLTSRAQPLERAAGLTLGADDYVTKPYEPAELLLRIGRLAAFGAAGPRPPGAAAPASSDPVLSYETFVVSANEVLLHTPGAVALVRCAGQLDQVASTLLEELRRRDLVGRYSEAHLVVLLPDLTAAAAADRVDAMLARLRARGVDEVAAGIACQEGAGGDVQTLLGEADLALASARVSGTPVAIAGRHQEAAQPVARRVLIAEDDPEVLHIVDPRLRAAGLDTKIAFDGQQALQSLARDAPDVVLLDLMMPKLTGFEVLARLRELPAPRPRVIVMSARGRENDVTRAFGLGADDYVTKPFSPQELTARILRLFR